MADQGRQPPESLIRLLEDEAHRFSFFQAVSLIQATDPDGVSVGEAGPVEKEAIRFTSTPSMGFATGDMTAVRRRPVTDGDGIPSEKVEIEAAFLGLYGPSSPLPAYFNEAIVGNHVDSEVLREFLDVFGNRANGLLYRLWRRYRHHEVFDGVGGDEISRFAASLAGLIRTAPGVEAETGPSGIDDDLKLLPHAATLGMYCHSGGLLAQIVENRFPGVSAHVEEWVRRAAPIHPDQRQRLGVANSVLGGDALLGDRVPDIVGKFRLWVGPIDLVTYRGFLPGTERRARLDRFVGRVLRDYLLFDVVLVLEPEEAPAWRLGGMEALGHTTWLGAPSEEQASVAFRGGR